MRPRRCLLNRDHRRPTPFRPHPVRAFQELAGVFPLVPLGLRDVDATGRQIAGERPQHRQAAGTSRPTRLCCLTADRSAPHRRARRENRVDCQRVRSVPEHTARVADPTHSRHPTDGEHGVCAGAPNQIRLMAIHPGASPRTRVAASSGPSRPRRTVRSRRHAAGARTVSKKLLAGSILVNPVDE